MHLTPSRRLGLLLIALSTAVLIVVGVLAFRGTRPRPPIPVELSETKSATPTAAPAELTDEDRQEIEAAYWASIRAMEGSLRKSQTRLDEKQRDTMTEDFARRYDQLLAKEHRSGVRVLVGSKIRIGPINGTGASASVGSCEDGRPVRFREKDGRITMQRDEILDYLTYTFVRTSEGQWLLSDQELERVSKFEGEHACA